MKDFFLGLLIGLLIITIPAKAIEATLSQISVKDLYATGALTSLLGRMNANDAITAAFIIADKMMEKRNQQHE